MFLVPKSTFFRVADSRSHRTRGSLYNCIVPSIKGYDSHTFLLHCNFRLEQFAR